MFANAKFSLEIFVTCSSEIVVHDALVQFHFIIRFKIFLGDISYI